GAIKGKTQTTTTEFYNLDVIISVGYRVKSKHGTQFRIWATRVLKDYLLKGYAINNRMNRIEDKMEVLQTKVSEIDLEINTHLIPNQGVFFDGQVFDAYSFVAGLVRSAKKSIIIIDNFTDDTVLTLLTKKKKNVKCIILTKNISNKLKLDTEKFNEQYPDLKIIQFNKSHDRFLIIDETDVYHIGASLKDLGKKWFAFSMLDKSSVSILDKIKGLI
ncbi:MAG: RhuM family protein, partial [Ignavibacteria bacterium]